MNSTQIEIIKEEELDERELSEEVQSKCSMIAICIILMNLPSAQDESGVILHNKSIKKIRKMVQKDVYSQVGKKIANEVIGGNLLALQGGVDGIKHSKQIPEGKHHLLLGEMSSTLTDSMLVGYNKFYV